MSKGNWVHEKFMDVFCEIDGIHYTKDYIKVLVYWWNQNIHGKPFLLDPRPQCFKIMRTDLHKWRRYKNARI